MPFVLDFVVSHITKYTVWLGHAPSENFGILGAQKCILEPPEESFLTFKIHA